MYITPARVLSSLRIQCSGMITMRNWHSNSQSTAEYPRLCMTDRPCRKKRIERKKLRDLHTWIAHLGRERGTLRDRYLSKEGSWTQSSSRSRVFAWLLAARTAPRSPAPDRILRIPRRFMHARCIWGGVWWSMVHEGGISGRSQSPPQ